MRVAYESPPIAAAALGGAFARQDRMPFLLDGALVARLDLKADRKAGALVVLATHVEPGAPADAGERLEGELRLMASWLGMSDVVVTAHANGT